MTERYKVEPIRMYQVVDTQASSDDVSVHLVTRDRDHANQVSGDMNRNHQNWVDAQDRIQRETLEMGEEGRGADS